MPKLKKNFTRFSPFETNMKLLIMGKTKCWLRAACGRKTKTVVFIVKGEQQSVHGFKDGKNLEIIEINPEGKAQIRAALVHHLKSIGQKEIPEDAVENYLFNLTRRTSLGREWCLEEKPRKK